MKRIIVPTDFSGTAWNATLHALEYANILDAEIVILNSIEEPSPGDTKIMSIRDELRKDSSDRMRELLFRINALDSAQSVKIHQISLFGELTDVLGNYISTNGNDIIVMGSQGSSGLQGKLFGSHTSRVVEEVDCPICIIPPHYKFSLKHGIGCAISEFGDIDDSDIALLTELVANYSNPVLKLLHISTEEDTLEDESVLPFSEFDSLKTQYIELIGENIPKILENYTIQEELNCLVLLKKDRNFIEKLFHKSVSLEVANRAYIPILILRSE